MRRTLLNTVFATVLTGATAVAVQAATPAPVLIPNQYIVVLDKAALPVSLARLPLSELVQSTLVQVGGGVVLNHYGTALTGFSARITANQAEALARLPYVKRVEQSQVFKASATQSGATWGLDRVDQRNLPMDGLYIYRDSAGSGVNVYVIDTGLAASHTEFTGRVGAGKNFAPNNDGLVGSFVPGGIVPLNLAALDFGTGLFDGGTDPDDTTDCNGHGTHVAGTAAGTVYGVAKKATIHAVRVLGCSGSGSTDGVIAGVDWVAANAVKPAVGNMSLGGGDSPALDAAVENVIARGISMAVAAGNDSSGACSGSPYKAPNAITVGSTDNGDGMSSFSNFGTCLDIFAPGGSITSADYSTADGSAVLSGTSMASPHVAGAIALILGTTPIATPAQVRSTLVGNATPGKVTSIGVNSPNLLLYTQ